MRFSPRPTSTSTPGIESEQLAADFRTDAAARAGDHHGAAFDELADDVHVQLHRRAAEQVADFDVADGDAVVAAHAVLDGADDLQFQPRFLAGVHQVPQPRPASVPAVTSTVLAAQAAATSRTSSSLPRTGICPSREPTHVVVHGQQAADAVGQFAIALHLAGQKARGVIGAHQQRPAEIAGIEDRPELLAVEPPGAAQRAQHGDQCPCSP